MESSDPSKSDRNAMDFTITYSTIFFKNFNVLKKAGLKTVPIPCRMFAHKFYNRFAGLNFFNAIKSQKDSLRCNYLLGSEKMNSSKLPMSIR